jgi:hypothetical protein
MGLSAFSMFEAGIVGLRKEPRLGERVNYVPWSSTVFEHLGSRLLPSDDKSRCTGWRLW